MISNEKPYIEYNGDKYEFEASFTLKRKFDKEIKEEYTKSFIKNNINKEQIEEIEKLQKLFENNSELKAEDLDEETKLKLLSLSDLIEKLDYSSVYEKYCYLMLKEKYDISKEEFELMLEQFANEYGFEFIDTLTQKVCEKVFTRVGEKKTKKTLPSWMN